jgi:cold shock CspA family protein
MTARFAFSSHVGTVVSYEAQQGQGEVATESGDRNWSFHCTQIDGGSRTIVVGTPVLFDVVAGLLGRWEAVRVSARLGAFLCPVCAKSIPGEPGQYDICDFCGWEDDPVQRDDQHYAGGANELSLHEARTKVLRAHIESVTGAAAPDTRG